MGFLNRILNFLSNLFFGSKIIIFGFLPCPCEVSDGSSVSTVFLPTRIASQVERSLWTDCLDFLPVIHFDVPSNSAMNPSKVDAIFKIT